MRILIVVLILIITILSDYDAFSEEVNTERVEIITVEQFNSVTIFQKNIERFLLVNPSVAEINLSEAKDRMIVKGISNGETPLYIWDNNQVKIFLIKTISKKTDFKSKIYFQKQKKLNENRIIGSYGLNMYSTVSKTNNNQSVINNLYLDIPLSDGQKLKFNTNLFSGFTNLKEIDSLTLNNITLGYESRFFKMVIGDTGFSFPGNVLSNISPSVKGISGEINFNKNALSIIGGKKNSSLSFISKNNIQENNQYIFALSDVFTFSNELKIHNSISSNIDFNNSGNNKFNFISGFNLYPLQGTHLEANIGNNLKGFGYSGSLQHKILWKDRGEWFIPRIEILNFGKGFLENESSIYNCNFSFNAHHISDLNISSSINFGYNQKNYFGSSLALDREIIKNLMNLNLKINYYNNFFENSINYSAGSYINYFFPTRINYIHKVNFLNKVFTSDEVTINSNILRNKLFNLQFNTGYREDYSGISKTRKFRTGITSSFPVSNSANLNLSVNYLKQFNQEDSKLLNNDFLNLSVNTRFKLWDNFINFSVNSVINIFSLKDSNSYFNIGYSRDIGSISTDELKGSIRGLVYEDVNENNSFDEGEHIFKNVNILVNNILTKTNIKGFHIDELDYNYYNVIIDESSIPRGYSVSNEQNLSTNERIKKVILDKKIKEVNFPLSKKNIVKGYIFSDKFGYSSLENIRVIADNNIVSVSAPGGYFSFALTEGKHEIKLDPGSLPTNYKVEGKYSYSIEAPSNGEIIFNVFPIITLEASVFNLDKYKQGEEFTVKLFENDEQIEERKIKSNKSGKFYLFDLSNGYIIIDSPKLKEPVKVDIPSSPENIIIKLEIKD